MASFKVYFLSIILSATSLCAMASNPQAVKGAYWPSWDPNFPPSAIDTNLFTHIYYAFLNPNNVTFKLNILDSEAIQLVNFTSTLHSKNPPVKALFSIGGGGEGPAIFELMVSNAAYRKNFIDSTIDVARKFGFDGMDLDWEFPQSPKSMANLALLLDEWRASVQSEAQSTHRDPLLITAAVYFSANLYLTRPFRSYPVASVNKNLDWVNVMNYDYHGSWEPNKTGAHSALFDPKGNLSTSDGLKSWIKAGVEKSKLIMGLPLYGKTWKLKDPKIRGIGAPAVGLGPGDVGVLNYAQIVKFNRDNNATVVFDSATVSTYSVAGDIWVGYDDARVVSWKIRYAQGLKLRGYFFWAVNGDYEWTISKTASHSWFS